MWHEPVAQFRLLHTVVVGSISSGGDHGVHCWLDPVRSKQLFSVLYVACRCLPGFCSHENSNIYIYIYIYIYTHTNVCVCMCKCVYIFLQTYITCLLTFIYVEVNDGNEFDSMKKIEKKSYQKWWIYQKRKSTLKRFGFSKLLSRL